MLYKVVEVALDYHESPPPEQDPSILIYYFMGIVSAELIKSLVCNQIQFTMVRDGAKATGMLNGIMYEKLLKMPVLNPSEYTFVQILNHFKSDT